AAHRRSRRDTAYRRAAKRATHERAHARQFTVHQPGVAPLKRGCHHRRGHCHEGLLPAEGAATDGAARQPAEQLVGLLAERTERVDDERRDTCVVADVRRELMMLMRLAEFALLDDALLAIDVVVAPGLDVSRRQGMEDADVVEHCTVDTVHDDVWPRSLALLLVVARLRQLAWLDERLDAGSACNVGERVDD